MSIILVISLFFPSISFATSASDNGSVDQIVNIEGNLEGGEQAELTETVESPSDGEHVGKEAPPSEVADQIETEAPSEEEKQVDESEDIVGTNEEQTETITVKVRIESFDHTIIPETEVEVSPFDLAPYNASGNMKEVRPIHAIIRALEANGIDPKDPKQFDSSGGTYISNVAGVEAFSIGPTDGWSYYVNNEWANRGVGEYNIDDGDTIVLYFQEDYRHTTYSWFENQERTYEVGEEIEVNLTGSLSVARTGTSETGPVEGATILVDNEALLINGEELVTNENGVAQLSFDTPGTYIISAQRLKDYNIFSEVREINDITRPYLKLVIEKRETVVTKEAVEEALDKASDWMIANFSGADHWKAIAINRAGKAVPGSYLALLNEGKNLPRDVQGQNGKVILGILAAGGNPSTIAGKDLYSSMIHNVNYSYVNINGIPWDLAALDAIQYELPQDSKFTREDLVNKILTKQLPDGGFSGFGSTLDVDSTGFAAMALYPYYETNPKVKVALDRTVEKLSQAQNEDGGFKAGFGGDESNSNSAAQALMAITLAGVDPTGEKFTKDEGNLLQYILSLQNEDGSFNWKQDDEGSIAIATEQVGYALAQYLYYLEDKGSIFDFTKDDEEGTTSVYVTVDGIAGSIYPEQEIKLKTGEESITALDALKQALDTASPAISYNIVDSSFGPYIQGIAGEEAGHFGGWDGWMFKVNDVAPDVGAGAYTVQDGDQLTFYYSRWADISTDSQLHVGEEGISIPVTLVGDSFSSGAENKENWTIDFGTTGLSIQEVEKVNDQEVILHVTGTAKGGVLSVTALEEALGGERSSDTISLTITQSISNTENEDIIIDENEQEVYIQSENEAATNVITLTFSKADLPKIEAVRGATVLEIPANTTITTSSWDQTLQIPYHLDIKDREVANKINAKLDNRVVEDIFARVKVGGSKNIEFNQHVTLILEGMGDKEAGFTDESGSFTPIQKYNDSSVRTDDVYAYANQVGDLIIKTKHFTEFLAFKSTIADSDEDHGGSTPTTPSKPATVKISVEKRTINEGDIISTTTIGLQNGDTAFSVLKRIANERGISIDYIGSGKTLYVAAIDGLSEFDHGPSSGWMYSVNGNFPDYSSGVYELKDGDVLRWRYTTDLGADVGNPYNPSDGSGNNDQAEEEPVTSIQKKLDYAANWILKNRDFSIQDNFNDWDAFALARAGKKVPQYYYDVLESYIKEKQGNFRLVTDYERMALAVTAIGKDPRNLAGYNFIEKIYNHERMTNQGTNGPVFALLALDARNYDVPANALWTREKLLAWILEQQNADGGFPLSKSGAGASDLDITAMTLQALSPYKDKKEVNAVIEKALTWLSKQQLASGGFTAWGEENSETISQVIIALTSLGIDLEDTRFVKKNGNLVTALESYVNSDGGMSHAKGESSNYLATQQGLMAWAAYDRFKQGATSLFTMSDITKPVLELSFSDVDANSFGKEAIYHLAKEGVILGYPDGTFKPNRSLTRGQAASLFVRLLNLEPSASSAGFVDLSETNPYFKVANAAKEAGIFNGNGDGTFGATDLLTREQMATVLVRAFNLEANTKKVELKDLNHVSESHRKHVEILYQNGITTGTGNGNYDPKAPVTRAQFAVFLVRAMTLLEAQ